MKVTFSEIAKFFKAEDKGKKSSSFYGKVTSLITESGEVVGYNVSLGDDDANTFSSYKLIGASVGDIVKVDVNNGKPVVTGRLGGDKDAADAQETAEESAKTATSYITDIDEENGIKVSAKDNANNYVQINSDGMSIHQDDNGTDTEVATFNGDLIELGKSDTEAIIKMCDGTATIRNYMQGSERISAFYGQGTTAVGEWDGATESYAFFKQGFAYIGSGSASIKFRGTDPTYNAYINAECDTFAINGKPLADFVIEQGTDPTTGWKYLKYANHTYEAWKTHETESIALTNMYDGAYSNTSWTEIYKPSFALTANNVVATCRNAARFVSAYTTSASVVRIRVYACASVTTSRQYKVDLRIRGTWS